MTAKDWENCAEPTRMIKFVRPTIVDRQVRLFAVACCRRIGHLLTDERCWQAVELAESFADQQAKADELSEAHWAVWNFAENEGYERAFDAVPGSGPDWPHQAHRIAVDKMRAASACSAASATEYSSLVRAATEAAKAVAYSVETLCPINSYAKHAPHRRTACTAEASRQADLMRDIFGNPLRPVTFSPKWRSETAVALASAIYADRAFDRMPILADALEDAGCDDAGILEHSRSNRQHVRGCWLVDLILQKR